MKTLRSLILILFAFTLCVSARGQEITTGVPIHPHPYSANLPLQTWQCGPDQLSAGTYMLEFKSTNGTVTSYFDCNGNLTAGGQAPFSFSACYASWNGNDTNPGTFFLPKATLAACYKVLPSSGGDIYVFGGPGGQGIPAAASPCPGLWIGGASDPNYASFGTGAYACWLPAKGSQNANVNIYGYGGTASNFATTMRVPINGGGNGSAANPVIWVSDAQGLHIENVALNSSGQNALLIAIDSNGNPADSSVASWQWNIEHVSFGVGETTGNGPSIFIGTNNFWGFMKDISVPTVPEGSISLSGCSWASGTATCTASNFTLTSVAVSGGSAVYTGTVNPTNLNFLTQQSISVSGFTNAGNNVVCQIQSYNATSITCPATTQINETHAAAAQLLLPSNWVSGQWLSVAGLSVPGYDGLFQTTISGANPYSFTYSLNQPQAAGTSGAASSDNGQGIVIGSPTGQGNGDLFFEKAAIYGGGGIRIYTGLAGSTVHITDVYTEDQYAPAVETSGCVAGIFSNVSVADPWVGAVPAVRVNATTGPTITGCAKNTVQSGGPPIVEFASADGPVVLGPGAYNYTGVPPTTRGENGIAAGQLYAQSDVARMNFGPAPMPDGLTNLANPTYTSWSSGGCPSVGTITATTAPDGTDNAGAIPSGTNACFYSNNISVTQGGYFIFGAYTQLISGSYNPAITIGSGSSGAEFVGGDGIGEYPSANTQPGLPGNGEWDWSARWVQYVGPTQTISLTFFAGSQTASQMNAYAPVLIYIPPSGLTLSEVARITQNLQSYRPGMTAGQVGLWPGEQMIVDSLVLAATPPSNGTSLLCLNLSLELSGGCNPTELIDSNGKPTIESGATASAVDYITATNGAAGSPGVVTVAAAGSDSNVQLGLNSKGTANVSINGMTINSPGTALLAPSGNNLAIGTAGANNLNFQINGTTKYSMSGSQFLTFAGLTLAGLGLTPTLGVSNVTAQSGSQSSVTLNSPSSAGSYLIRYYVDESAGCTTLGSASVVVQFGWTDGTLARTSNVTLTPAATNTASNFLQGTVSIYSAASVAITYQTTYTACSSGTWTYDLHATVERTQ